MNMKTVTALILMGISLSSYADLWGSGQASSSGTPLGQQPPAAAPGTVTPGPTVPGTVPPGPAVPSVTAGCQTTLGLIPPSKAQPPSSATVPEEKWLECKFFESVAKSSKKAFSAHAIQEERSMDGLVVCRSSEPFVKDFDPCVNAIGYYNAVLLAETAMEQTQLIRTDLANKDIQAQATQQVMTGDGQNGMFDAAKASNEHMKKIEQEKMVIYGAAVAALISAHQMIPSKEDLPKISCTAPQDPITLQECQKKTEEYSGSLLANSGAKSAIGAGIAKFAAKAIAAGLKASMFGKTADQIAAAQETVAAEGEDLMMDRCAFNPTDPACAIPGTRVSSPGFTGPTFGMGDTGSNSFNMNPGSEVLGEDVAPTDLGPTNPIADVNSPFVDEANAAKDIINPAGAAQFQATGGAQGGGAGAGGGGGLGGGGASLGSDVDPADKEGNKEPQIKAGNVSGTYAQGGGAGYKAVGKGKDNANPFASLFDAKSGGGVEEDRSIASGDIDGKSSGLFQKISKRYGLIQADKRIEANNLE